MKKILFIFLISLLFLPTLILAHPGRTDSSGCHTCRTNCDSWGLSTGEYHCHQAKTVAPQPVAPIKSHKSDTGTGYTTPAPEYKVPKTVPKPVVVPKTKAQTTQTTDDKEKVLINAVNNMPKTTEKERISLFTKLFRLIFGN